MASKMDKREITHIACENAENQWHPISFSKAKPNGHFNPNKENVLSDRY